MAATSECALIAGHLDGHANALKRSTWHCPMQHVQGYIGSHWTLPSVDYLLRIAPVAAMATINKTTMQNVPILLAVLMAITMQHYNTACIAWWRRFVASTKATKRLSTRSDNINRTRQRRMFLLFHREKGLELTCWPLITIGVWHIKLMRKT